VTPQDSAESRLLATIDVGTNSVLLQVARRGAAGQVEVLEDRATITRLGQGIDRTQRLDDAAVARTLSVLSDYARRARELGARIVAVGTSAARDATNAAHFLAQAERILGTPLAVLSGNEEAELTYLGATQGLSLDADELCVVDIGGGSTEIVRGRRGRIVQSVSLDIGAVRLTERHGVSAPATPAQLAAVEADVARALAASRVKPSTPLVAIAGTATTLAAILGRVAPYDPKRIHGARVSTEQLRELTSALAAMPLAERHLIPGLDPGRADVIVTGALLLLGLVKVAEASEITVSNGGVRMGLAVRWLSQFPVDPTRGSE
jgi:exopolyphosphatase/guanosine-5'-triphosphate,3'-diphosphate pyrophosphatase